MAQSDRSLVKLARRDPQSASFYAFQQRLRTGQLRTPELDNRLRSLYGIPSQLVQREAFMADRTLYVDEATWNSQRIAKRLGER